MTECYFYIHILQSLHQIIIHKVGVNNQSSQKYTGQCVYCHTNKLYKINLIYQKWIAKLNNMNTKEKIQTC